MRDSHSRTWHPSRLFRIVLGLGALAALAACSTGQAAPVAPDAAFVHAHTGGIVSVGDPVRIEFVDAVAERFPDAADLAGAFSIHPAVPGSLSWEGDHTLVFRPSRWLERACEYQVDFKTAALKAELPAASDFGFRFATAVQVLECELDGLQVDPDRPGMMLQSGLLRSADLADVRQLEQALSVSAEGPAPVVAWEHDAAGLEHRFTVMGIERGSGERSLGISWRGAAAGGEGQGETRVAIPAVGRFALLELKPVVAQDTHVELVFSDPVDPSQDLRGLVSYRDESGANLAVKPVLDRNRVRVYTTGLWPRKGSMTIDGGLRSQGKQRLVATESRPVAFPSQKPAVRFVGSGVIMPSTQGLTLPIETMNLKYVMVEATRVWHSNVPQFLQVNNLSGTKELYRVGRVVWRQVVDLGWKPENQDRWVRNGLDLSKLLASNPDGLFRIKLSFRINHVVWNATTGTGNPQAVTWPEQKIPDINQEASYWDSAQQNNSFDYGQRNNPADPAYYQEWSDHRIDVTRSLMVSDIGLLASRGSDGSLVVAATDLRSAKPWAGLELDLLDYSMHSIKQLKTGPDGLARLDAPGEQPFFVVGHAGTQYGYLRLGDSDSRTVSSFDVAGEANSQGIKGFLYGERGVWRPGDTVYLNFILQDSRRSLPKDHPVVLELYNPQGQLAGSWTRSEGLGGFYHFAVPTSASAPTGTWNAQVKVGGKVFNKAIPLETVMPNRLKIDFELQDSPNGVEGQNLKAQLGAAWLTGAKSPGLRAKVRLSLSPSTTEFPERPELKDFSFDDPARIFEAEPVTVFDGNLDNAGKAEFTSEVAVESLAPGKLRAHFDTRVYEPGGAFSVDAFSTDFHAYERYVGIKAPAGDLARGMLLTDVDHSLEIRVVGPDGKPVQQATQLRAEIFQIRWRWWWEGSESTQALAEYMNSRSFSPVKSELITVKNGQGQWKFRVNYPSWGRYLIRVSDVEGRHSTGVIKYIDWPGWAGRNQKDGPGGAAVLRLTTDRTKYQAGDMVSVSIPGNQSGRILVGIEKNGRLIREEWVEPSAGGTTVWQFAALPEMAPNVYVHVTFLQAHLQTQNDLPIRTYGIVPVLIENPASRLVPRIQSADNFKPGQKATVRISEANGQAMTYTLAVVDEGLLGLTRHQVQDPWPNFYKREASLLKTWDLYDFVAGAFTGTLENLLAIGGSDDWEEAAGRKADRFPPVVRCLPPASLAAGETKELAIDLPEYVGAVRLMVVAANQPAGAGAWPAYGAAQKTVTVTKEVMVLATLPRVLSPGEEAEVPVTVFYGGAGKATVPVSLSPSGQLALIGAGAQSLAFNGAGEKLVKFRVKAKDATGLGSVRVVAKGAADSATQDINLDVRLPASAITVALAPGAAGAGGTALSGGQAWSLDKQALPGFAGTNKLAIELSSMPPIDLGSRLDYLIQYPHGCIEQTTSGVFPQLFLGSLMELSAERQAEIQKNVEAGIARLQEFQLPSGGMSYWPGEGGGASAWGTNYAGHFLLEARRAGYAVSESMLEAWRRYQLDAASRFSDRSPAGKLDQAYRLYTLALDGSAELASLNRLKEQGLSDQANWRLAAAYLLMGQANQARELVAKASTAVKKYRELGATFGSEIRDRAMILESLALLELNGQALALARELAAELGKAQWLSTQETAYGLIALSRLSGLLAGNATIRVSYNLKDSTGQTAQRSLSGARPVILSQISLSPGATSFDLNVKNTGSSPVFVRVLMTGVPAPGNEKEQKQGLILKTKYYDADGQELPTLENLEPGSDIYAEILVQNLNLTQAYEQLAITQLVPSGFEIINDRLSAAGQEGDGEGSGGQEPSWFSRSARVSGSYDWRDIRDDRVLTYFSLPKLGQKLFRVHLVAAYKGRYWLPSIKAEAMYDASINALVPGSWISIGEDLPVNLAPSRAKDR